VDSRTAADVGLPETAFHEPAATGLAEKKRGTQMSNVRVERMMKELQAEPSLQFFEWMLDIALPARRHAELAPVECVVAARVAQRAQRLQDEHAMMSLEKAA
jgi:hypothetical protein